jgi:acetoin utilization protein AcuB
MRRHFVAVTPHDSVEQVRRVMRMAGLRHVPVVEAGVLVGTLSYRRVQEERSDLAERQPDPGLLQRFLESPIEAWVQPDPEAIESSHSLEDAARRMLSYRVGYLPVVEGSDEGLRIVGIVTEADLLRIAYARGAYSSIA